MLNAVVDLSHWQTSVNFARMRVAGIRGVIHKATQGTSAVDPVYHERRHIAESEGLLWGAYHFGTGVTDPTRQAEHFLATVGPKLAGVVLALDFEPNPQGVSMSLDEARAFVTYVAGEVGRFPMLYSGHWLKQHLALRPDGELSRCPLWLAQYGPVAIVPDVWRSWTLWQYTDGMHGPHPHFVDGVGFCDRNRFNGTSIAALEDFWEGRRSPC